MAKRLRQILAALRTFVTGVPPLTPEQQARLDEIDREHAEWMASRKGDKKRPEKSV